MEPVYDCPVRLSSLGALSVLPDYLLNLILLHLEEEADLARTASASRVLRVLCCEEPLWIWFCFKNHDGKISFLANWRQTALHQLRSRLTLGSASPPPGVKLPDDHAIAAAAKPLPSVPGLQSMFLYRRWCRRYMDVSGFLPAPPPSLDRTTGADPAAQHRAAQGFPVERLDVRGLSPAAFAERFDEGCLPALLVGAMEDWAGSEWTFDSMLQAYGDTCFSVARPTSGQAPMLLRDYVDYMRRQADEEPLYIFDSEFVESAPRMGQAYMVPSLFDQDLLGLLGPMRPHFRWLVAGPVRSGASWHVDPSLTSAWNALLNGRKRWLLYPPHVVPPGVSVGSEDSLTSLQWLLEVYPLLTPDKRPMELVQSPGQVVFVPGGWWHCVLNLEPSVAVTQNFASRANLRRVLRHMSHGSEHYHDNVHAYYEPSVVRGWKWNGPREDHSEDDSEDPVQEDEDLREKAKPGKKGRPGCSNKRAGGGVEPCARECATKHPRVAAAAEVDVEGASLCEGRAPAQGEGQEAAAARDVERRLGVPVLQLAARVSASPAPASASGSGRQGGGSGEGGEEQGSRGLSAGAFKMQRKKQLGHWLRKLWVQEPELRPDVAACMDEFLAGPDWQHLLSTVCSALRAEPARGAGAELGAAQQVAGSPLQPPQALGCGEEDEAASAWGLSYLPLCGVSSMVYLSGDVAIKFITEEDTPLAHLMCAMEVTCSLLLQPQRSHTAPAAPAAQQQRTGTSPTGEEELPGPRQWRVPVVLACGVVNVETDDQGSHTLAVQPAEHTLPQQQRQRQQIPFVVTERVDPSCVPLSEALSGLGQPQKLEVAAALGRLVGQLHLLGHSACTAGAPQPLPALTIQAERASGAPAQPGPLDAVGWLAALLPASSDAAAGSRRWVWHNRHGSIWTSQSPTGSQTDTGAAWEPFVSYLRSRRKQAAYDLEGEGALPPWLLRQVEAYLPEDPAALLGLFPTAAGDAAGGGCAAAEPTAPGGSGTAPALTTATPQLPPPSDQQQPLAAAVSASPELGMPWLLHGDLFPGNILASSTSSSGGPADAAPSLQLSVLDFADAGHGDPLYDLMVLLGGCCELDTGMMRACWRGYCSLVDVDQVWPHAEGAAPRSRRAMCYCMLHEEDVVLDRALRKVAGAHEAAGGGGLVGLEQALWGFLDE